MSGRDPALLNIRAQLNETSYCLKGHLTEVKILSVAPILASAVLITGAGAQEPSAQTLLHTSNGAYTAFQHKDWQAMQGVTTADFAYVGPEGRLSGKELAEATKGCDLKSFSLSEPAIKELNRSTAILTYVAHQDESCDGKSMAPVLINLDVLVRRKGEWLILTHMETPANGSSGN